MQGQTRAIPLGRQVHAQVAEVGGFELGGECINGPMSLLSGFILCFPLTAVII
jgi:hypothetical protein